MRLIALVETQGATCKRTTRSRLLLASSILLTASAMAQAPTSGGLSGSDRSRPVTPAQGPSTESLSGSGRVEKPFPGVIHLTILDAINRALRNNLALLLSQQQAESARAQRRRNLSALLPNVSGNASESVNQINLQAFGIPLPPGLTSPVVGPFGLFDAHASMSETFLDLTAMNRVRSAAENERAAAFTVQDARELVVLAAGNQYLRALADAARLDTAQAQLATAQAIFQQAEDMKKAGVNAGIDVLRAQVQMQAQQQRVLAAQNEFARQKMTLARAIGLPVSQAFELADTVPYAPLPELNVEEALARAYQRRPEYLAAQARVRSAELEVEAAKGEAMPVMEIDGQYGILGQTPGNSERVFNLAAGLRIPLFQGGKVKADVAEAETSLRQDQMQLEDLRGLVEYEVRTSWLDVKTSNEQVGVAQQSIVLAGEQLKEAQDRYAAGVSGSLDVVQAQEAVANANETYIQSLYLNNVAKLSLAHALGVAEQQTKTFLGGK